MQKVPILFVDDEPNILDSMRRHLRKTFAVDTAVCGKDGLELVKNNDEYAVVVSDMRMPEMDGATFLSHVKRRSPNSVRIMLTGLSDIQTAISAVNEGNIFRFLNKPCPPPELKRAVFAGVAQYRLLRAENELLEKTLKGSIKVLTDILSLSNPTAFGRAMRIQSLVTQMAEKLEVRDTWKLEIAAMLSQIGCMVFPEELLSRMFERGALSDSEQEQLSKYPKIGHDLVANIPRMEDVARIILYQQARFDGVGRCCVELKGAGLPQGSRILKVALDFDDLLSSGMTEGEALCGIDSRDGWYDPEVVKTLHEIITSRVASDTAVVNVSQFRVGMILRENLLAGNGSLLAAKGTTVTSTLLERIKSWLPVTGIREPITVQTQQG